ncbi:MAG: radical SAM protein [Planctomycetota bacterium]
MAQVVLVYPITGLDLKGVSVWLPLSVLNVAATLADDYDVAIIDQRVDPDWRGALRAALNPDTLVVGISCMTGTQIRHGLEAARVVRDADPSIPIVWGGNHPTLLPQQTAEHPLVDCVVIGEGEHTFRAFVEAREADRGNGAWKRIGQIAFREHGTIVQHGATGKEPFLDPDLLPPLPYHLVDVEQYVVNSFLFGKRVRSLPFISSTGCPFPCTFCCEPVLSSQRWRKMSAEVAFARVMSLVEKHRLDAVEFHDEEFFVDRRRGARIADMIGGRFQWYVQTRMDDLVALDEMVGLRTLESNGLRAVQPGLETGSPRILKMIRKQETVADYRDANRRLARTAISGTYNFMMGFPTETVDDLMASVDLALEMMDANPNAHISGFFMYTPTPGAKLYELALQDGFRPPDRLEGWTAFNRQHLESPWIGERRDLLETLLFTSKLVDGERIQAAFRNRPLVRRVLKRLGERYRRMWRRHAFRRSLDVRLLGKLARSYFGW